MNAFDPPPARIRIAIVLSIAAHLCALWLLALLLDSRFVPPSSETDRGVVSLVTTIEHRARLAPPPAAPRRERPRATPAPVAVAERRLLTTVASHALIIRPLPPTHAVIVARPSLALVASALTALPTAAITPRARAATPADAASPPPAIAATTPAPAPSATHPPAVVAASFGGLFTQNYPPALAEPSALAEIRTLASGRTRIRIAIDVDETGQATGVRFVAPASDPQIEDEIRSKLLALHYVPADCNGLHCDGTLEVTL
ncbi:MAG: hypothetical protein ABSB70_04690 [Candidatus Velthaea sp.]